jgi:hypothetical protein
VKTVTTTRTSLERLWSLLILVGWVAGSAAVLVGVFTTAVSLAVVLGAVAVAACAGISVVGRWL